MFVPTAAGSTRLRRQQRRDTKPELAIRREAWGRGLRYRVDAGALPGLRRRADMVFTRLKVAVFVDGCYWHRCPEHATFPKANAAWWADKFEANVVRDRDTDERLRCAGWTVVRLWEHEEPVAAVDRLVEVIAAAEKPRGHPSG